MPITPYRPSTDLLNPFFDDFFGRSPGGRSGNPLLRAPEADVVEREQEIQVTLEMPGMEAGDIEISLENNVLTISGEKKQEREEKDEESHWHLTERRYGQFSRSFVLPRDVDAERIDADFHNGILTVRVPKSEKARRRRIEIRGSGGGSQRVASEKG